MLPPTASTAASSIAPPVKPPVITDHPPAPPPFLYQYFIFARMDYGFGLLSPPFPDAHSCWGFVSFLLLRAAFYPRDSRIDEPCSTTSAFFSRGSAPSPLINRGLRISRAAVAQIDSIRGPDKKCWGFCVFCCWCHCHALMDSLAGDSVLRCSETCIGEGSRVEIGAWVRRREASRRRARLCRMLRRGCSTSSPPSVSSWLTRP